MGLCKMGTWESLTGQEDKTGTLAKIKSAFIEYVYSVL